MVGHGANVNIDEIRYACAVVSTEWPKMRFLRTLVMARAEPCA